MLRKGEFTPMSSLGGTLSGYFGVGCDFYLPSVSLGTSLQR
ncbi:hypothetical protein N9459_05720 [Flavobacteriaceae bacterium]|nr:hypothetical protein [Flavobacteriaceae bacterium]